MGACISNFWKVTHSGQLVDVPYGEACDRNASSVLCCTQGPPAAPHFPGRVPGTFIGTAKTQVKGLACLNVSSSVSWHFFGFQPSLSPDIFFFQIKRQMYVA